MVEKARYTNMVGTVDAVSQRSCNSHENHKNCSIYHSKSKNQIQVKSNEPKMVSRAIQMASRSVFLLATWFLRFWELSGFDRKPLDYLFRFPINRLDFVTNRLFTNQCFF
jgi:hypothetical protein